MIGAVFLFCGCSYKPPIYPDFCKKENKTYSNKEKIVETLLYITQNADKSENNSTILSYDNSKIMIFYRTNIEKHGKVDIFRMYLEKYPDCCAVIRPPLYTAWYSGMRSNGFSDVEILGKPGDWVADVAIEKTSLKHNRGARLRPDFKVSDCNEVSMLPRG
ncbi:MAG: hypothetical protein ABI668_14255 [Sphingorhabdus sp.]